MLLLSMATPVSPPHSTPARVAEQPLAFGRKEYGTDGTHKRGLPQPDGGFFHVADRAGLGLEMDEDVMKHHVLDPCERVS